MTAPSYEPLRILAVSTQWLGADDNAFVSAFRRDGHSVRVINPKEYTPNWVSKPMKLARRFLTNRINDEFNAAVRAEAEAISPDLFFVFKGANLSAESLRFLKKRGAICVQFFPDVSFQNHGDLLSAAMKEYDWVFTTKSFMINDLRDQLGYHTASVLLHGYDPDTHRPVAANEKDRQQYACDVSFVGNISAKKSAVVSDLGDRLDNVDLRVWGPKSWRDASKHYQDHAVFGLEFAKAISLSKINLGLLMEQSGSASMGDQVTSRTFHIPASGGFMLHERTDEAEALFEDGKECAFFDTPEELVDKIYYYLKHEDQRAAIAQAGRERCLRSGYSIQNRARSIVDKYLELRSGGSGHV